MNEKLILDVRGLSVEYDTVHGVLPAVSNVSLQIRPGEVVALVGESGSGKSTTAHAILRLLAENARVTAGQAVLNGIDLLTIPGKTLQDYRGRHIGLVPQEPSSSLNPVMRIGEQIAETLRRHGLADRRGAHLRAVELLEEVGLDQPERRASQYPHELSGGMRQRVLIAIAISCGPSLIIADEPTSALDVTVQRTVLDRLDALIDEYHASMLLVTHDLGIAADRADRVIVMQRGQIVEDGESEQVLRAPSHPYTRHLITAAPSLANDRLTISIRPEQSQQTTLIQPLLVAEKLYRRFAGRHAGWETVAVNDISFSIERGRTLALVGESGSGKTTTARIVARLERADRGRVLLDGQDITEVKGAELRSLRRKLQVVHQNPYSSLDPRQTVRSALEEAAEAGGLKDRTARRERAVDLLDQVKLARSTLDRRPRELSGGQRQRVAIAKALAVEPSVLILDEPVSALDVSVQDEILRLLVALQEDCHLTYLFISHDLAVVRQVADKVLVMRGGEVLEAGSPDELLARPSHPYTLELVNSIPGRSLLESPGLSGELSELLAIT